MIKKSALIVSLLVVVMMVFPASAVSSDGGVTNESGRLSANSLNPFLTITQRGDYVAAGIGLRGTGSGTITINGIPGGATVTHAFLYWAILDDALDPSFDKGRFNGIPIVGNPIGEDTDPCWEGATTTFAFRANVTPLVQGNGSYTLIGFASGGDTVTPPLAEGATLVVLFRDPAATENRDIVIYEGADTINEGTLSVSTTLVIPPIGSLGSAKTTYIVADGQSFSDSTIFNDVIIAGDAFNGSDGDLWDRDSYDITGHLSSGDTSIKAKLERGTDCLVHIAQIFSASSSTPLIESIAIPISLSCPPALNPLFCQVPNLLDKVVQRRVLLL